MTTLTEFAFRRRLAAALTGTGLAAFAEQGPAVSAVLAECRAAGLELAAEPSPLPKTLFISNDCAAGDSMGDPYCFTLIQNDLTHDLNSLRRSVFNEAVRRYNAFPALEARAARLAAALGELLAIAEAAGGLEAERLRRAVAEGRAALAEGGTE